MDISSATSLFATLSSGIRLQIFRLLVRRGPDGMVSGDIASALNLPATNTSFHLKAMAQTGLLTVEQEGRYQRYRADMPLMIDLIAYLTDECCSGHPEACLETAGGASPIVLASRPRSGQVTAEVAQARPSRPGLVD
jgi:DNA-binding transcriptional ArsR family regulator